MRSAQLSSTKQMDPKMTLTMVQDLFLKAPSLSWSFSPNSSRSSASPVSSTTHRKIRAACGMPCLSLMSHVTVQSSGASCEGSCTSLLGIEIKGKNESEWRHGTKTLHTDAMQTGAGAHPCVLWADELKPQDDILPNSVVEV